MPQPIEHIDWADRNEEFAKSFYLDDQLEINWAITLLFYSALHYADAYIVARGRPRYDHASRERSMHDVFFDPIRTDYKRLKDLSREARYNIAPLTKQDFAIADAALQRIKAHILPRVKSR